MYVKEGYVMQKFGNRVCYFLSCLSGTMYDQRTTRLYTVEPVMSSHSSEQWKATWPSPTMTVFIQITSYE